MKNRPISRLAALLFCFAMLLTLTACQMDDVLPDQLPDISDTVSGITNKISGYLPDKEKQPAETEATAPVETVPETEAAPTVPMPEYVVDAYAGDCTYTADMYNYETGKSEPQEFTCIFRIPEIKLPGSTVEKINREIYDTLYPVMEAAVDEIEEYGFAYGTNEISYRWSVYEDILSLVVLNRSMPDFGGGDRYMVYNISLSSGEELPPEAVAAAAGLSESEFYENAKQVLGSSYWAPFDPSEESFGYDSFVSFFNEQYNRTVSKTNIDESSPYFNEAGQLCLIAKQYSMAGGDYYWYDLNMVDFELSPYYACEAGQITHTVNISEEEAYRIACDYWNYEEGQVAEETGFQLYLISDGLLEESDGNKYYAYRLRWWVPENNMMSTIDMLYINAETGECSYEID